MLGSKLPSLAKEGNRDEPLRGAVLGTKLPSLAKEGNRDEPRGEPCWDQSSPPNLGGAEALATGVVTAEWEPGML